MPRILIKNGYVVTVDSQRNVFPGGYVATDGQNISAVGPTEKAPVASGFDEVIDATGCIVLPGLINMHQHHWYTLFKGLADGYLLEDWVSGFLLPLAHNMTDEAMRVSSTIAGMEMLATGTTCSLNHSVTTTTPAMVAATIEPQAELGLRQVFGKELRCNTPGNPKHPLSLDESLAAFEQEARRWHGSSNGRVRFAATIESNAHWVAAGMSTEELITRGYQLVKKLDLRITDHIAGGTFSLEKGFLKYLRETGRTDVRYLMQLGILDPHWILIHGIHVTELDIEQMAHVGCSFVYTPTSESMRRADGRLLGRHGGADEDLRHDAACAPPRSDPHAGRARDRDGNDQRRQDARAGAENRLAGKRQARGYRDLRSQQTLCRRAAPADFEFRLCRQGQRRARRAGGRRDRVPRRRLRAPEGWDAGDRRGRAHCPFDTGPGRTQQPPSAGVADVRSRRLLLTAHGALVA
jgi:cytosine/adenosine deaminase-related metal-dependent hydrolase